jgi:hypothetical protein
MTTALNRYESTPLKVHVNAAGLSVRTVRRLAHFYNIFLQPLHLLYCVFE